MRDKAECCLLLTDLEQSPTAVQLHHADLESVIGWCKDEIYEPAKTGEDQQRKMEGVAVENGPRRLVDRWKKRVRN